MLGTVAVKNLLPQAMCVDSTWLSWGLYGLGPCARLSLWMEPDGGRAPAGRVQTNNKPPGSAASRTQPLPGSQQLIICSRISELILAP